MKDIAQPIFYGLIVELFSLLIGYIFRERKLIAIFVVIVGTIVAGIIAFVPFPNIFGLSQAKLVFDENFDDGVVNGITFSNVEWAIVNIDKTDKALRANNDSDTEWSYVQFAEQTITNGTVEYSVNLISYDVSLNCSGCIAFSFRSTSQASYVFAILPDGRLSLYYGTNDEWIPLTKATSAYNLSPNTWHQVKITLIGGDFTVYFDGTKVLSAKDDRLKTGSMNFGIAPSTIAQFDDLQISTQP